MLCKKRFSASWHRRSEGHLDLLGERGGGLVWGQPCDQKESMYSIFVTVTGDMFFFYLFFDLFLSFLISPFAYFLRVETRFNFI